MNQILAMHGWAGDGRSWASLAAAATARGWRFEAGERGYGAQPPQPPQWQADGRRVLITHSMGPLLLPEAVLSAAEAVVLLAGFARFVPDGAAGRRLRTALAGMAANLQGTEAQATAQVRSFLSQAAAPLPLEALGVTILERPLPAQGRGRLLADLAQLTTNTDLPLSFPRHVPCLIVEAGQDQIVVPEARCSLRQALPHADLLRFPAAGHALLACPLAPLLTAWIEALNGAAPASTRGGTGA